MGTLASIGIGIPFGSFDSLGAVLAASGFYAPLKSTLVLTRGTGNPTYSRATAAWEFDNEGKLIALPSNVARFGGGRAVVNLCPTPSNTLTVGANKTVTFASAAIVTFSMGAGAGTATFSGTGGATGTLSAGASRVQVTKTITAGTFVVTASVADLVDLQIENVSGQSDQTASDYVSVGVLSAPYHGAGVDGVKWFDTNKAGTAISEASLLGYHAEGARTNSLLYSRQLALYSSVNINRGTTNLWLSSTVGSELCTNGGFDTDTDWVKAAGWTISGGVASCVSGNDNTLYQSATVTPGKQYTINFTLSGITSGYVYPRIGNSVLGGSYVAANGTYTLTVPCLAGDTRITFGTAASFTGSIDNVSVKEAAIQVTPCTGIDNAANSASTLTAGAANATILQTLSLAAAARSSSAYVKRRTGTGNIYMTRDGGTNWTDITASVGSSWTRVKIENTSVLNPSIGFKIATSGDAIDVDCVQDEAGACISSPIITTTAAVTRNTDALTYAFASNALDAVGSCLITGKIWSYVSGNNRTFGFSLNTPGAVIGSNKIQSWDGTSSINTSSSITNDTSFKFASTWSGATRKMCLNSDTVASGAYDGTWNATNISIGTGAGGEAYGYLKDAYIWQTAITDAQLQQVTA